MSFSKAFVYLTRGKVLIERGKECG